MEILNVKNLSKIYKKGKNIIKAVDDVSFTVNEGEFIAIIGKSGSGKSTLLHMIGGVDKPTSGEVIIDGKNIYSLNKNDIAKFRRKNIGLIYQFYNLLPVLNVEENITLPVELDGKHMKKEELEDILKTLGLTERRKNLPNELSGGQEQRVSIGRAISNNPKIILADEPTGNLDTKNSKEIIDLLRKLNSELNKTIIIITHDMEIAENADRLITIENGKIILDKVRK